MATAFAQAWQADPEDAVVRQLADEIHDNDKGDDGDPLRNFNLAIELIQDQFRPLATDPAFITLPPTPPAVTARRRFGDSKDLALLLVCLLRRLGCEARPVIVNTNYRKSVSGFLPMPGLFDRALVECRVQGQVRWIDPTVKLQGGGVLHRVIPNYGLGLPIHPGAGLAETPDAAADPASLELTECILVDTAGAALVAWGPAHGPRQLRRDPAAGVRWRRPGNDRLSAAPAIHRSISQRPAPRGDGMRR